MSKILIIGDLHFKTELAYSEYFEDFRKEEEAAVIKKIIDESSDCQDVVLLGDQLNHKNNSSIAIDKFVKFLESFNGKNVYIIAGNHEQSSSGKTAIDFLKEVKHKSWNIFTNEVGKVGDMVFLPYISKESLGVNEHIEATRKVVEMLPDGKYLFHHHAYDSSVVGGISASLLSEVVLPADELSKKYLFVAGGHIHSHMSSGNILTAGSVFTSEVGEHQKYVWKLDTSNLTITKIELPVRGLYKLEDPNVEDIDVIPDNSLVKIVLTEATTDDDKKKIKQAITRIEAKIIIEQTTKKRNKTHATTEIVHDFSTENMVKMYAKSRGISEELAIRGFNIIKQ